jgi:hypothetical protein
MKKNKYMALMEKAAACRECAKATSGLMRSIWLRNAIQLEDKARKLKIDEM